MIPLTDRNIPLNAWPETGMLEPQPEPAEARQARAWGLYQMTGWHICDLVMNDDMAPQEYADWVHLFKAAPTMLVAIQADELYHQHVVLCPICRTGDLCPAGQAMNSQAQKAKDLAILLAKGVDIGILTKEYIKAARLDLGPTPGPWIDICDAAPHYGQTVWAWCEKAPQYSGPGPAVVRRVGARFKAVSHPDRPWVHISHWMPMHEPDSPQPLSFSQHVGWVSLDDQEPHQDTDILVWAIEDGTGFPVVAQYSVPADPEHGDPWSFPNLATKPVYDDITHWQPIGQP